MKKIVSLLLALVTVAVLGLLTVSCSSEQVVPEGMMRVTAANESFHLYVPSDWQDQSNSGVSGARFGNNEDKSNVTVTRYLPNTVQEGSADYYWGNFLKPQYKEQYGESFVLIEEGVEATMGGLAAKKYVYTMAFGGVQYKQMQVLMQAPNADLYIFTYTARVGTNAEGKEFFDAHLEAVAQILAEFRVG